MTDSELAHELRERCDALTKALTQELWTQAHHDAWNGAPNFPMRFAALRAVAGLDAPSPARSDLGVSPSGPGSVVASLPSIPDADYNVQSVEPTISARMVRNGEWFGVELFIHSLRDEAKARRALDMLLAYVAGDEIKGN